MMLRTIAVLLLALILCSFFQQKSIIRRYQEPNSNQLPKSKTGLKIETTPTRGTGLTDSLGFKYGIVHVTNTITNDSTIPILLQIALPMEFSYPISDEFKIALWPGLTEPPHLYTDSQGWVRKNCTGNDLEASNHFNKRLAPGEEYVVTIATIQYPTPSKTCSVVAYSLVQYSERKKNSDCDWTIDEKHSTAPQLALGLHVGFCTSGLHYESCTVITCGQITYIED